MAPPSFAGLSSAEAAMLAAMGPRWSEDIVRHREQVVAIYTPHLSAIGRSGIAVDAGLAYGTHARHTLDIFRPHGATNAPVVVFVHGGAFMRGDMNSNAEIYGNVTRFIARHGYVAVNLEYRLAPEARYPGGAQDIALALDWIGSHIGAYGGNRQHIVLAGHSAGGAHAATYAIDPVMGAAGGRAITALVLISARLRADTLPDNPNSRGVRAYWGDDATRYEQLSPVTHAARLSVPTLVAIAEFENPHLDTYGAEFFYRALQAGGRGHRFVQVPGHNHTSIVAHLGTEDQSFGAVLIDFLQRTGPLLPT